MASVWHRRQSIIASVPQAACHRYFGVSVSLRPPASALAYNDRTEKPLVYSGPLRSAEWTGSQPNQTLDRRPGYAVSVIHGLLSRPRSAWVLAALSFHLTRADLLASPRLVHTAGPCARHFWQHIHAVSERPSPSHMILLEPQNGQLTSASSEPALSVLGFSIRFRVIGCHWSPVAHARRSADTRCATRLRMEVAVLIV